MRHILDFHGMSNLILNIINVLIDEIDMEEYKNKHKFFQNVIRTVASKPSYALLKNDKNKLFLQTKKLFKKERYLNLNIFNNRIAITKITLSSHNLAINTSKRYKLHEDMKIYKNCKRKEIENEIYMIFSCDKYDKIWKKPFKDLNEVDNIKLQIGNKLEKLKVFITQILWKLLIYLDSSWREPLNLGSTRRK